MIYHISAMVLASIIDWLIGDPKGWPHPVKGFGKLITWLDNHLNRGNRRKINGMFMVGIVASIVLFSSLFLVLLSYYLHPIFGMIAEGCLIATTISANSLRKAALEVYSPLNQQDIPMARKKLSCIVGRDTDQLQETDIIRGAVETVAENTSDGITAPLFWGLLGGAPFALVYRAVNTCDSMVGYQNDRYQEFGYASAKLDDILNWIPARLTALTMLLVVQPVYETRRTALTMLLRDAHKHKSPNSGWGEAAVASLLGIQLGGVNTYQGELSIAERMGNARQPLKQTHILQTITIMQRTASLFLLILLIGGVTIGLAITWIEPILRV